MKLREQVIKKYFNSWIINQINILKEVFDDNIIYTECYGPVYSGIDTILLWFENWHKHGKVLNWNIKQFIHEGNFTVVEWYFKCEYKNNIDGFDGVSIITFNDENKIINLKEFQSKAEHYYPYK